MQINKIDNNNVTFNSRIKPKMCLLPAFNRAIKESDHDFYKSLKSIINDGIDRELDISLVFDNDKYHMTTMLISDRPGGYWTSSENNTLLSDIDKRCKDIIDVIKIFAKRELNPDAYAEELSDAAVSERLEMIKKSIFFKG